MTAPAAALDALGAAGLEVVSITPEPTDEERAAIMSAFDALGSRVWSSLTTATTPAPSPRWRYAGRRWSRRPGYGGWA